MSFDMEWTILCFLLFFERGKALSFKPEVDAANELSSILTVRLYVLGAMSLTDLNAREK